MDLLTWDERSVLSDRGLLPSSTYDRIEPPEQPIDMTDRYRGVLVGLGVGDALGKPIQRMPWNLIEQRHGYVNRYLSAPIEQFMLPPGQITDDTQQALMMADSIVATGRLSPTDLVKRLEAFLPVARTAGDATLTAIRALRNGMPWTHTGQQSAGNGALSRALVAALPSPFDVDATRMTATVQTVITHSDHTAVAASVAVAAIVAHLLATPAGRLDTTRLLKAVDQALAGVEDPAADLRRHARSATVGEQVRLAIDAGDLSPHEAYEKFGTGGYVMEALPLALWAFVHHAEDPVGTVVLSVSAGGASSAIGGLASAFAGAYHGVGAFPDVWLDHLEYVDGLAGQADRLAELAGFGGSDRAFRPRDPLLPAAYTPFSLGGSTLPTLEHAIRASAAPDPTASVKVRLVPTPADARRMSVLNPPRQDWPTAANGMVAAILKRKFAPGTRDAARLARASTGELQDASRCLVDEPFDYVRLLEQQRSLVLAG